MADANKVLHDFKNLVQWRVKIEKDLEDAHRDFKYWSKAMDELFLDLGMNPQIKGGNYGYLKLVKGEKGLLDLYGGDIRSDCSLR